MKPLIQEVPWRHPETVFHPFATEPWAILLQSKICQASTGRYSFIGFDPFDTIQTSVGVFERLQDWTRLYVLEAHPNLPPLQGGILGFLGYEASSLLPSLPYDTLPFPDVALGCYDALIVFDHPIQKAWVISSGFPELDPILQYQRATVRLAWLLNRYETPALPPPIFIPVPPQTVTSNFTPQTYQQAVLETQEAILNGDFFEANISQRFQLPKPAQFEPWAFYVESGENNLAPFSAYFSVPEGAIICHSPERFIQCMGREARTYPIKGTRRRDACFKKDAALQQALEMSEKDRAENIMIVDLMRNDFSPVCLPHTVKVTELCKLNSFSTVHHLISTIQGTLAPAYNAIDLLQRCFPGGSITGAPKIEVMKHIQKIEQGRRGPYCGMIGYISFHETLDTAILIRTCIVTADTLYFQVGGAITLDSDPELEYQETLDKAQGFLRVLSDSQVVPAQAAPQPPTVMPAQAAPQPPTVMPAQAGIQSNKLYPSSASAVLILDNYDSFVHNLAHYVTELGFHPRVYRNDAITLEAIRILNPTHIILSPGPRTPQEAGLSLAVIQAFYQTLPILGVCLGHQAIAAAFGGDVVRARYPMHGKSCTITHTQTGLFEHLPNPLRVGRYHSLVACPRSLPDCLEVTAYDNHQEIMALQHRHFPIFGVQFHPESVLTEHGHALLKAFLEK